MDSPRHEPDIRRWFADDELEECPRCRQRTALVTPSVGTVICTECGVVGFRGASDAA